MQSCGPFFENFALLLFLFPFAASNSSSASCAYGDSSSDLARRDDGPSYNPEDWSRLIPITTLSQRTVLCTDFPDTNGPYSYEATAPTKFDAFCWQNNTAVTATLQLKTTQECYVPEITIEEYQKDDFRTLLPWCGPVRPYEVYNTWPVDPVVNTGAWAALPCWTSPTLDSTMLTINRTNIGMWTVHTYCWFNGTTVGSSNRWYKNAQKLNGAKCYFPYAQFNTGWPWNGTEAAMPGGGDECP